MDPLEAYIARELFGGGVFNNMMGTPNPYDMSMYYPNQTPRSQWGNVPRPGSPMQGGYHLYPRFNESLRLGIPKLGIPMQGGYNIQGTPQRGGYNVPSPLGTSGYYPNPLDYWGNMPHRVRGQDTSLNYWGPGFQGGKQSPTVPRRRIASREPYLGFNL